MRLDTNPQILGRDRGDIIIEIAFEDECGVPIVVQVGLYR
jgi:hypothetical protein